MSYQEPDSSTTYMSSTGVLTTPLTRLIGREEETALAAALLRDEQAHLVTLLGPGGVGKTRLAIHLAHLLTPEFDQVHFVSLASVREPAIVLPTIARALGLRGEDHRPFIDRLAELLSVSRVLLILDNVEQVLEASPDIAVLLQACPGISALVTSRSPLRIGGEHEVMLAPLAVPDLAHLPPLSQLVENDAIALFLDRAREVQPRFTANEANIAVIAEICSRLDGLPLALELAAARCKLLSPQTLLSRLSPRLEVLTQGNRDLPDRLRTMRNAIAWSYDLLPSGEQTMFRRLAVFVDGFSLDAAKALSTDLLRASQHLSVLDSIASLADQSLLQTAGWDERETRFMMLETIREFGLEHLEAHSEGDAVRRLHALWCMEFAERGNAAFWGTGPGNWRSLLEQEHANLRSGLEWLLDHDEAEATLGLATALEPMWWVLGHGTEGRSALKRALEIGSSAAGPLRVKALAVAARLEERANNYHEAYALAGNALCIARQHDDQLSTALALDALSGIMLQLGRPEDARKSLTEAIATYRHLGDRGRLGWALCTMALLACPGSGSGVHRTEQALVYCQEALEHFRAIGQRLGIARALHGIAYLEPDSGRRLQLYRESLIHLWNDGAWSGLASDLEGIAPIARRSRRPDVAAKLYGAAAALRAACGVPRSTLFLGPHNEEVAALRESLGAAAFDAAWAEGWAMSPEQVIELAQQPFDRASTAVLSTLTSRQHDILERIAAGQSNREIADALFLSVRTVEDHVSNLLARLGVASRTEAARMVATIPNKRPHAPVRDDIRM